MINSFNLFCKFASGIFTTVEAGAVLGSEGFDVDVYQKLTSPKKFEHNNINTVKREKYFFIKQNKK